MIITAWSVTHVKHHDVPGRGRFSYIEYQYFFRDYDSALICQQFRTYKFPTIAKVQLKCKYDADNNCTHYYNGKPVELKPIDPWLRK